MKVKDHELTFEWDKGNVDKSYEKHGVTPREIEEIFTDEHVGIVPDIKHSGSEKRLIALGKTENRKNLFVVFTMRKTKIRVISARRMHKKEEISMKKLKTIPKFKSEAEERRFWQRVDSTDYVDYSKMEHWSFPNLKLTSRPITLRLYASVIDRLKIRARKMDMPYQTLIKQYIFKGLASSPD